MPIINGDDRVRPALIGPYAVTYQTANIDNPGDGTGALVGPVLAAGTLVLAAWLDTTLNWTAATSIDEVIVSLATAALNLQDVAQSAEAVVNAAAMQITDGTVAPKPAFVRSGTDRLAVAFFTTGGLTAGAGNIYAVTVAT